MLPFVVQIISVATTVGRVRVRTLFGVVRFVMRLQSVRVVVVRVPGTCRQTTKYRVRVSSSRPYEHRIRLSVEGRPH